MLGVCAVHPKGESTDYDGLYYRDDEMAALARDLSDKPLLVEHDSKPVGRVLHAYKNDIDKRLYAIFETNTDTFGGCLAGSMLKHGLVGEVSLGHNCQIESSNGGNMRVIGKNAVELSLVEKGARPETKIYGKTIIERNKRYINNSNAEQQYTKMSDTDAKPQIPQTVTDASSPDMVKQLLEQVRLLTEKQTKLDQENENLKSSNAQFAEKVEIVEAAGKRKREQAIDGSIKDYFQTLMAKYEETLKPHETEIGSMLERMKGNSASEPLVQALACAAAAAKGSVAELEKAYQSNKRLKTEIDAKDELLKNQTTQAFAKPAERVVTEVRADASATASASSSIDNIFSAHSGRRGQLKGRGMKETNPEMFKQLIASAPMGQGLPKLDEFMGLFKK